jgi:hypothetical protein
MTYGEDLVEKLLRKLPKSRYYWSKEPIVSKGKSTFRHPDFVLVSSELGVVVLEVKDWKKIIRLNPKETEIQRSNGEVAIEKNPVKIAREYALNLADEFEKLDELMCKHRGKRKLKFPWMYAVALPHIEPKALQQCEGVWGEGFALGKDDLIEETFEDALHNLQWPWELKQHLDTATLDVIRGVIDPTVIVRNEIDEPVGIETNAQTIEIQRPLPLELLSQDAESLAQSTSVRLVRGVAGSGKSLVLARRAQFLAEQNPGLNILVLAFNVDLVQDLKRRISGASNLEVINFHKMCSQILGKTWRSPLDVEGWLNNKCIALLQQYQFTAEFVAEEIEWRKELQYYDNAAYLEVKREGRGSRLSRDKREVINTIFSEYVVYQKQQRTVDWSDVPYLTLSALQAGHALRHHYDVILIDEAQDFAPSWIQVVKELLKPNGALFMCDDPTQSLFRSFSWKEKGVEVQGKTRILKVPFRSTRQITEAAHSLIAADTNLKQSEDIPQPDLTTYELATGPEPALVYCRDLSAEVQYVEQQAIAAKEKGIPGNQIAILCHNKRLIKHWAHLRDTHGFYVGSFNQMKGLEFQTVFLPHLQTVFNRFDADIDDTFVSETRRRIFTAMTRARENLMLSYHDKFPAELAPVEPHIRHETAVLTHRK